VTGPERGYVTISPKMAAVTTGDREMLDFLYLFALIVGGTVLLFQFAMMLLGLSNDSDLSGMSGADVDVGGGISGDLIIGEADWHEAADADLGHPGGPWFYEVLSLRTLSAAATFFGLTGKTLLAYDHSPLLTFTWASVAGLAAMWIVYWLFKQVYKLQHSGTEDIRNALGRPASVYVPIPGNRAGLGKVTFRMQDRLVEYQAVTEDHERLKTGEKVVVVGIVNSETVRVARAGTPVPDMTTSAL
jgi:hypothetical protein